MVARLAYEPAGAATFLGTIDRRDRSMLKVLLAEDNRLNQLVAVGVLKNLGCEVTVVDTGIKAIVACVNGQFDVVLMDIMMPEADGYEAVARIRVAEALACSPRTPVIGLSARAIDGDREIAIHAGMDDYITKPLHQPDLVAALDRCLGAVPEPRVRQLVPIGRPPRSRRWA